MGKTIVVIGGSYAGIGISHSLLRDTLVKVPDLKVILVSTTTHAYMSLASPRGIIPGQIGDDRLFAPMAPGFSKYPAGSFELVIGKAEKVDDGAKNFAVRTEDGKETVISYDILVIATGASTGSNTAWKQSGSFEDMKKILADTRELVKNAASIAVGGGGSSGVEIAGELGFEYMDTKEITLVRQPRSPQALHPSPLNIYILTLQFP
jgi:NADH dehydrogenase FAD-containing subunit